jgi:hypothetical protein
LRCPLHHSLNATGAALQLLCNGTVDFIAAPYRFEVLPGVGHFAADQAPGRVTELLLAHLEAFPV